MPQSRANRLIAAIIAAGIVVCASGLSATAAAPAATPAADRAENSGTALLLNTIVTWLAVNFGLPANYDHPRVAFMPAKKIATTRYGSLALDRQRDVVAIYHDKDRAIYIAEGWDGRTPAGISVLVHEMVHHLQNMDGRSYPCAAERERLAYAAQEKWLRMFGRSLKSEFEIDLATLKLSTSCM